MKNRLIAAVLAVLVLAGAGGYGFHRLKTSAGRGETAAAVPVIPVADLQSDTNTFGGRFNGVVETQKKKSVTLDTEKTVESILVAAGDHVKEKDPLFTYNTEKTMLDISQKELEKEKLNAQIQGLNEQIAQLNAELNKGNLSSADRMSMNAQILENQTSIAQAEYDLKVADSEIATLQNAVDNAAVPSPMDGTIEKVEDPSAITDSSTAFITIVADGDLRVKGTMSEQNFGTIYEGQKILVRSRSDQSETWTGTVTSLESGNETEDQNRGFSDNTAEQASRYAFYVTLDSKEDLLLGQHVTLEPYQEETEGLVLPLGYIVRSEDGSGFVYAVGSAGARLEKRAVELGVEYADLGMVQIVSGLSEDEYVCWPDNENCTEGAETASAGFTEDFDNEEETH